MTSKAQTKTAEPTLVEPEVVVPGMMPEDDEQTHAESLALVVSANAQAQDLLSLDPVKLTQWIANRELVTNKCREIAITRTKPMDWTAYKERGEGGRIVYVPRASALAPIRTWLGIDIFNYRPKGPNGPEPKMEQIEVTVTEWVDGKRTEKKVPTMGATLWADAVCRMTGRFVQGIQFTARQDRFAGSGTIDDLRASARTGIDSKCTKILSGLTKVSDEELRALGVKVDQAYKGHGFGTAQDRDASRVAEPDVADRGKKLWADILRRVGGDMAAAKDLLRDITFWEKDGKSSFAKSVEQLTLGWQLEKAEKKLAGHQIFGDRAKGSAPAGGAKNGAGQQREPGGDDGE